MAKRGRDFLAPPVFPSRSHRGVPICRILSTERTTDAPQTTNHHARALPPHFGLDGAEGRSEQGLEIASPQRGAGHAGPDAALVCVPLFAQSRRLIVTHTSGSAIITPIVMSGVLSVRLRMNHRFVSRSA